MQALSWRTSPAVLIDLIRKTHPPSVMDHDLMSLPTTVQHLTLRSNEQTGHTLKYGPSKLPLLCILGS
eukprot:5661444-Amphidinium_carterae.1